VLRCREAAKRVQRAAIRPERTRAVVANVSASRTKIYPALSVITSRSFPPFVKARRIRRTCILVVVPLAERRPGEKTEESQRFSDPKLRAHVGTAIGTLGACNKRLRGDCLRRIDERSPLAREQSTRCAYRSDLSSLHVEFVCQSRLHSSRASPHLPPWGLRSAESQISNASKVTASPRSLRLSRNTPWNSAYHFLAEIPRWATWACADMWVNRFLHNVSSVRRLIKKSVSLYRRELRSIARRIMYRRDASSRWCIHDL